MPVGASGEPASVCARAPLPAREPQGVAAAVSEEQADTAAATAQLESQGTCGVVQRGELAAAALVVVEVGGATVAVGVAAAEDACRAARVGGAPGGGVALLPGVLSPPDAGLEA